MTEKLSLMEKTLLGVGGSAFLTWMALPYQAIPLPQDATLGNYISFASCGIISLSGLGFFISRGIADIRECYKPRNYNPSNNTQKRIIIE